MAIGGRDVTSLPALRNQIDQSHIAAAVRVFWRAAPGLTLLTLSVAVARGVVPNLLYLGTSALAAGLATASDQATIVAAIVGITASYFLIQTGEPVVGALEGALGRRVDRHLQRSVIVASLAPRTIGHLETDDWRQAVSVAREWETSAHPPSRAVDGLSYMITATVWALGSAFFLLQFVWWAPLLVMGGWLVMTFWGTRFREGPALARIRSATPLRRATYYRDLAFEAPSARESRLFGLAEWLRDRSERSWQTGMARIWEARAATRSIGLTGVAVLVGGYLMLMTMIMQAAFEGVIDVGRATLYVQACGGLAFLWMPWAVLALKEATAPMITVVFPPVGSPERDRDPSPREGCDEASGSVLEPATKVNDKVAQPRHVQLALLTPVGRGEPIVHLLRERRGIREGGPDGDVPGIARRAVLHRTDVHISAGTAGGPLA